jgi:hypothetical protein
MLTSSLLPCAKRRRCLATYDDRVITRRTFIAGGLSTFGMASVASMLSSCASSESEQSVERWQIVQRFPQIQVPGRVRLPISLADQSGLLSTQDLPSTLTASLVNAETGAIVVENVTAARHDSGLSIPYWPFRLEVSEVGTYALVVEGGPTDGAGVQILDPSSVGVPLVGSPLRPFDTPTVDDPRGVEPICTRSPEPCPFHDFTLTDALSESRPVIYLIGTPAHCSTGTCAPALDGLLALRDELSDRFSIVHAEVYTDDTATTVAPAVEAYAMTYEPALFVTDAEKKLVERLDAVFDEVELRELLLS